jgi:hypothetical protein
VIAGNPARPIGTVEALKEKNKEKAIYVGDLPFQEKKELLLRQEHQFIIR